MHIVLTVEHVLTNFVPEHVWKVAKLVINYCFPHTSGLEILTAKCFDVKAKDFLFVTSISLFEGNASWHCEREQRMQGERKIICKYNEGNVGKPIT